MKNGLNSVLIALAASGCLFSEGADDTDGDTEATDTEAAETGAMTAGNTATSDASTATPTSSNPSTTNDPSSSSGEETACDPFVEWLWAGDVPAEDTTFPQGNSTALPPFEGEPVMRLRAATSGEGTAALSFEIPCTDEVFLWALTWDAAAGIENADAYQIGLDQDADEVARSGVRWEYGCDNESSGWDWYRVRDTGPRCDPDGQLEPTLDAGEHHLQINNTEPVSNDPPRNATGLAALVVTNDPEYDPRDDYDPSARD